MAVVKEAPQIGDMVRAYSSDDFIMEEGVNVQIVAAIEGDLIGQIDDGDSRFNKMQVRLKIYAWHGSGRPYYYFDNP